MKLNIRVTRETSTGRNVGFRVNGSSMNRAQTVRMIETNSNSGYHVRNINGIKTPVSNPSKNHRNNLG